MARRGGIARIRRRERSSSRSHQALQPVWARARAQGSKKVCERRLPEYQQLVAKLVTAAKQFGDVLIEHHAFVDEIRQQGASWSFLRPLNLESFGSLDGSSPVTRMIAEAIENGHVPSDVDPKWKMPADLSRLAKQPMAKRKNAVSGAIDAILSATDILIGNALPKASSRDDRAARLARAECEVADTSRSKLAATNRSAKLAESERSVKQQTASARDVAAYRARVARRGW
jgi:hypothetical protein